LSTGKPVQKDEKKTPFAKEIDETRKSVDEQVKNHSPRL
jgi:hypothetical protein